MPGEELVRAMPTSALTPALMPQAPPEPTGYAADPAGFASMMYQEIMEAEQIEGPEFDQLVAHYAAYRLSADLEYIPYQEHVRLPLSRAATNDRVARFAGPFIRDRNPIVCNPFEGTEPAAAEANTALLNTQWRDPRLLNGPKTLIQILKLVDLGGTGYVFVDWVQEKKVRYGIGMLQEEQLDLDGPRWRVIHPRQKWRDPRADCIQNMRYFWISDDMSLDDFNLRAASGWYPQASEEALEAVRRTAGIQSGQIPGVTTEDRFSLPLRAGVPAPTDAGSVAVPEGDKIVRLYHRFSRDKWIIASVSQEVLREVPNPCPDGSIPLRDFMVDPDLQGPSGVPPAEAGHGMNANANSLASAALEVARRAGTPTLLLKESEQDSIVAADITGCSYEFLVVKDPERAVKVMEKGSEALQVDITMADWFKAKGEQGGMTNDYQQGTSASGAPGTATGTQGFLDQVDSKFSVAFALISNALDDLIALTALYNQTFLEKKQWLKRVGRIGVSARTYEVDRPMLQGEFEYTTTAASAATSPAQTFQNGAALVNVFGAMPGIINIPFLAREMAKAAGFKNPEKVVPAFVPDPIPVEDAVAMVRLGLPVPPHPADDNMDFADAFLTAAMEAQDQGNEEEARLLAMEGQKRLMLADQLRLTAGPSQDQGNADGSKASDKGRPVPGKGSGPDGGSGLGGMAPGPPAPPGRDMRPAGKR